MQVRILYGVGRRGKVADSGEQSAEADPESTNVYNRGIVIWGNWVIHS